MQSGLGQSLATRPELDGSEVSACLFEDEDGLHIHSFIFRRCGRSRRWRSPSVTAACIPCVNASCRPSAPYRLHARNLTIVDGNAKELLLNLFKTEIEQQADEIGNVYHDYILRV